MRLPQFDIGQLSLPVIDAGEQLENGYAALSELSIPSIELPAELARRRESPNWPTFATGLTIGIAIGAIFIAWRSRAGRRLQHSISERLPASVELPAVSVGDISDKLSQALGGILHEPTMSPAERAISSYDRADSLLGQPDWVVEAPVAATNFGEESPDVGAQEQTDLDLNYSTELAGQSDEKRS